MTAKQVKPGSKIVYATLGALLIVTAALVLMNRGDAGLRKALEENREFQIKVDREVRIVVGLQDLLDMDPEEFTTTLASSAGLPREVTLKGVELRRILEAYRLDITDAQTVVFSGLDGYYSPLTREEVEKEKSIYVCFSMDGEILRKQGDGGYGPFMMVIRGSRYAQRWCKYVESVEIKS